MYRHSASNKKNVTLVQLSVVVIVILAAAMFLTLSETRYFDNGNQAEQNSNSQDASDAEQESSPAAVRQALEQTPEGIKKVDNIQSINTDPVAPAGWKVFKESEYGLGVAHPPEWRVRGSLTKDPISGEPAVYYLKFFDISTGKQIECCSMEISYALFAKKVRGFESNDTSDDGKVVTEPLRYLRDVKEKDIFMFNGKPAVKYLLTLRSSESKVGLVRASYFIDANNKTYKYSLGSDSLGDDGIGVKVLKQLNIN